MEIVASRLAEGAKTAGRIRVLIADRSAHYRETLRRVLAHYGHCEIVGEASSLKQAASLARALDPDVALLDFDLVVRQSAARLRRLAQSFPSLQVIILLTDYSEEYRHAVKERWGYWCVAKDQVEEQLAQLLASPRQGTARLTAS
jgi:DNA-binding NarL/FixJ family response regulator